MDMHRGHDTIDFSSLQPTVIASGQQLDPEVRTGLSKCGVSVREEDWESVGIAQVSDERLPESENGCK